MAVLNSSHPVTSLRGGSLQLGLHPAPTVVGSLPGDQSESSHYAHGTGWVGEVVDGAEPSR